jgi:hypothetical protein
VSNARYFADGTEFYRVVFGSGSIDGPYVRVHAAKRVGESGIKVRRRFDYNGKLIHEWQSETTYKIEKLVPMFDECGCCLTLGWDDYELHG